MVDLKNEPVPAPKKSRGISITTVKNWLMPDKKISVETPKFQKMPENFLRSLRRRSLRIKRTKSLVLPEKRKSGECFPWIYCVCENVIFSIFNGKF